MITADDAYYFDLDIFGAISDQHVRKLRKFSDSVLRSEGWRIDWYEDAIENTGTPGRSAQPIEPRKTYEAGYHIKELAQFRHSSISAGPIQFVVKIIVNSAIAHGFQLHAVSTNIEHGVSFPELFSLINSAVAEFDKLLGRMSLFPSTEIVHLRHRSLPSDRASISAEEFAEVLAAQPSANLIALSAEPQEIIAQCKIGTKERYIILGGGGEQTLSLALYCSAISKNVIRDLQVQCDQLWHQHVQPLSAKIGALDLDSVATVRSTNLLFQQSLTLAKVQIEFYKLKNEVETALSFYDTCAGRLLSQKVGLDTSGWALLGIGPSEKTDMDFHYVGPIRHMLAKTEEMLVTMREGISVGVDISTAITNLSVQKDMRILTFVAIGVALLSLVTSVVQIVLK